MTPRIQFILNLFEYQVIDQYCSLEDYAKQLQEWLIGFGGVLDAHVIPETPNYLKILVRTEPFGGWIQL